jgi:hypothetical protein
VNGSHPTATQIAAAITLASRAPSVHNTQPWRWRVTSRSLELFADPTRRLHAADKNARLLMLSCGATLHHLAVAIGAEGWHAEIHRFPDATLATKLASIDFTAQPSTPELRELARAIADRRSDRRPMSSWPVPVHHADRLVSLAAEHGGIARVFDPRSSQSGTRWRGGHRAVGRCPSIAPSSTSGRIARSRAATGFRRPTEYRSTSRRRPASTASRRATCRWRAAPRTIPRRCRC